MVNAALLHKGHGVAKHAWHRRWSDPPSSARGTASVVRELYSTTMGPKEHDAASPTSTMTDLRPDDAVYPGEETKEVELEQLHAPAGNGR